MTPIPERDLFRDADFSPLYFADDRTACDACDFGCDYGEPRIIAVEQYDNGQYGWSIFCRPCANAGEDCYPRCFVAYLADGFGHIVQVLKDTRPKPVLPRQIPDAPMSEAEFRQIHPWGAS